MGTHVYRFFDLIMETGTFHVQCDWIYPRKLDLDDASSKQDNTTECCHVTVTDSLEYYTRTITRDFLLHKFKDYEAAFKEQKSDILEAAFQGESSYKTSRLQWKISKDNANAQLNMQLQIINDQIPLTVGSFDLVKAPQDQVQDLKKLWFKHLDLSSITDIEINKKLKQRIADTEKTNREYRKTIESTNIHERQKRYVIIDKFLRLLNTKKLKIYQLQQQVQQLKRRLDNNEDSDEDLSVIESSTSMDINRKKQIIMQTEKTTRSTVASKGKRPLRNDEYEVDFENEWEIENESKYEERVVVEEDFIVAGPSTNPVIKKQKVRHTNE